MTSETPSPTHDRSWWTTLPGIITAIATLLTAVTGLLAVLLANRPTPQTTLDQRPPGQVAAERPAAPSAAPPGEAATTATGTRMASSSGLALRPVPPAALPPGVAAKPADAVAVAPTASTPAKPPAAQVLTAPPASSAVASDPPPLVLGEELRLPTVTIEVIRLQRQLQPNGAERVELTMLITAGLRSIDFQEHFVRLYTKGVFHPPERGWGVAYLGGGGWRRLSSTFLVEPEIDMRLRFTDSAAPDRTTIERRLPRS